MRSIVGIFASRSAAEQSMSDLLQAGVPRNSIILLSGEAGESKLAEVPTTDAEPDGMGKAVGALVGGATGAGAGLSLGTAAASLLVPGVGPIFAVGIGAAALLGLGGAVVGAEVGDESEKEMDIGPPKDDTFFFRELLRRGRTVVIVESDSDDIADTAERIFKQHSGEDVDEARAEIGKAA